MYYEPDYTTVSSETIKQALSTIHDYLITNPVNHKEIGPQMLEQFNDYAKQHGYSTFEDNAFIDDFYCLYVLLDNKFESFSHEQLSNVILHHQEKLMENLTDAYPSFAHNENDNSNIHKEDIYFELSKSIFKFNLDQNFNINDVNTPHISVKNYNNLVDIVNDISLEFDFVDLDTHVEECGIDVRSNEFAIIEGLDVIKHTLQQICSRNDIVYTLHTSSTFMKDNKEFLLEIIDKAYDDFNPDQFVEKIDNSLTTAFAKDKLKLSELGFTYDSAIETTINNIQNNETMTLDKQHPSYDFIVAINAIGEHIYNECSKSNYEFSSEKTIEFLLDHQMTIEDIVYKAYKAVSDVKNEVERLFENEIRDLDFCSNFANIQITPRKTI